MWFFARVLVVSVALTGLFMLGCVSDNPNRTPLADVGVAGDAGLAGNAGSSGEGGTNNLAGNTGDLGDTGTNTDDSITATTTAVDNTDRATQTATETTVATTTATDVTGTGTGTGTGTTTSTATTTSTDSTDTVSSTGTESNVTTTSTDNTDTDTDTDTTTTTDNIDTVTMTATDTSSGGTDSATQTVTVNETAETTATATERTNTDTSSGSEPTRDCRNDGIGCTANFVCQLNAENTYECLRRSEDCRNDGIGCTQGFSCQLNAVNAYECLPKPNTSTITDNSSGTRTATATLTHTQITSTETSTDTASNTSATTETVTGTETVTRTATTITTDTVTDNMTATYTATETATATTTSNDGTASTTSTATSIDNTATVTQTTTETTDNTDTDNITTTMDNTDMVTMTATATSIDITDSATQTLTVTAVGTETSTDGTGTHTNSDTAVITATSIDITDSATQTLTETAVGTETSTDGFDNSCTRDTDCTSIDPDTICRSGVCVERECDPHNNFADVNCANLGPCDPSGRCITGTHTNSDTAVITATSIDTTDSATQTLTETAVDTATSTHNTGMATDSGTSIDITGTATQTLTETAVGTATSTHGTGMDTDSGTSIDITGTATQTLTETAMDTATSTHGIGMDTDSGTSIDITGTATQTLTETAVDTATSTHSTGMDSGTSIDITGTATQTLTETAVDTATSTHDTGMDTDSGTSIDITGTATQTLTETAVDTATSTHSTGMDTDSGMSIDSTSTNTSHTTDAGIDNSSTGTSSITNTDTGIGSATASATDTETETVTNTQTHTHSGVDNTASNTTTETDTAITTPTETATDTDTNADCENSVPELCDGADNDCDGHADEDLSDPYETWNDDCREAFDLGQINQNQTFFTEHVSQLNPGGDVDWFELSIDESPSACLPLIGNGVAEDFTYTIELIGLPVGAGYELCVRTVAVRSGPLDFSDATLTDACGATGVNRNCITQADNSDTIRFTRSVNDICGKDDGQIVAIGVRATNTASCSPYTLRYTSETIDATSGGDEFTDSDTETATDTDADLGGAGICDNPWTIRTGEAVNGDTSGAQNTIDPPSNRYNSICGREDSESPDHVYRWVPTETKSYNVRLVEPDFDAVISIFEDCDADSIDCEASYSFVEDDTVIGVEADAYQTYYIVVSGRNTDDSGAYTLQIDGGCTLDDTCGTDERCLPLHDGQCVADDRLDVAVCSTDLFRTFLGYWENQATVTLWEFNDKLDNCIDDSQGADAILRWQTPSVEGTSTYRMHLTPTDTTLTNPELVVGMYESCAEYSGAFTACLDPFEDESNGEYFDFTVTYDPADEHPIYDLVISGKTPDVLGDIEVEVSCIEGACVEANPFDLCTTDADCNDWEACISGRCDYVGFDNDGGGGSAGAGGMSGADGDEQTCTPGETVDADDGCNTCVCPEDGDATALIDCSEAVCEGDGGIGGIAGDDETTSPVCDHFRDESFFSSRETHLFLALEADTDLFTNCNEDSTGGDLHVKWYPIVSGTYKVRAELLDSTEEFPALVLGVHEDCFDNSGALLNCVDEWGFLNYEETEIAVDTDILDAYDLVISAQRSELEGEVMLVIECISGDCLDLGPYDECVSNVNCSLDEICDAGQCKPPSESDDASCSDGLDNDNDLYIDCADYSCSRNANVTVCDGSNEDGTADDSDNEPENNDAACADGADNDGDGYIDCADHDCSRNVNVDTCGITNGIIVNTEANDVRCQDGLDNDGNGYVDCQDHSCSHNDDVTVCEETGTSGTSGTSGGESGSGAGGISGAEGGHAGGDEEPDWTTLFDPPTELEIDAVLTEWSQRSTTAVDWNVENTIQNAVGFKVEIVSHTVSGETHYGYIRYPKPYQFGQKYPVVVLNHGGNNGHDLSAGLFLGRNALNRCTDQYFVVAPTYRGEGLRFLLNGQPTELKSGGPTPNDDGYWSTVFDGDVDDTIHLLNGALSHVADMDPNRIGVHGGSRGSGVSYLFAVREPRVKLMALYYGATNHMTSEIRDEIAIHIENGQPIGGRDVGLAYSAGVEPYLEGTLSFEEARAALLRRSVYYFSNRLPRTEFFHGTNDGSVSVDQSRILANKLRNLGDTGFAYYEYEGGGHSANSLQGTATRTTRTGISTVSKKAEDRIHEVLCDLGL